MRSKKGFSLTECVVLLLIVALVLYFATPRVINVINNARRNVFESKIKEIHGNVLKEYVTSGNTKFSNTVPGLSGFSAIKMENIEYYVEINSKGEPLKIVMTDGTYKFEMENLDGLKSDAISSNVFEAPENIEYDMNEDAIIEEIVIKN